LYDLKDNASLYAGDELFGVAQEVADFLHERKIIDKSVDVTPLFDGHLVEAALAP